MVGATLGQWLLFLHVTSAALFVGGGVVAGAAQLGALQRERPSEIAALLKLARYGVAFVGPGSLATLGFGLWLAHYDGYGFGRTWIDAAIGLWVLSMAAGGAGGRVARHARERAERLAAEDDAPDEELSALVAHRPSLLLSYLSSAALVAILVLMVWKPGG